MISSLITWDNLGQIIATVLAVWGALALIVGITVGRSIRFGMGDDERSVQVAEPTVEQAEEESSLLG